MENCSNFFKDNYVPTNSAVSKLIPYLFGVERCTIYKGHTKTYCGFKNLAEREDSSSEITLPTNCQNIQCITNAINFTMPTSLLIGGEVTLCHLRIEPQTITLNLRNKAFTLEGNFAITQKTVDGLVHLMAVLPLCEGMDTTDTECCTAGELLDVCTYGSEPKKKIFSKSCNVIINKLSKLKTCPNCVGL